MTSFAGLFRTRVTIGSLQVGFVELDASLQETHSFSSEVTDHPVEDGSNVADHVKQNADELSVSGVVSNYPAVWMASLQASGNRAEAALEMLLLFKGLGSLVDVMTDLREYSSMVLTRVEVPRDPTSGDGIYVTLHLQRVHIAKSQTSDKPVPAEPRGAATEAAGKQAPVAASPAQATAAKSVLAGLAGL